MQWLEDDFPLWHQFEEDCAGCYQQYEKFGATWGCTFCKRLAGHTVIEFTITEVNQETMKLLFGEDYERRAV